MISEKIERILDRRLGRGEFEGRGILQQVDKRIAEIEAVQKAVDDLDRKLYAIKSEKEHQQGEFYTLLMNDPEAAIQIDLVNCKDAKYKIAEVREVLVKLRKRFERKAVRIAFVGYERMGKSSFLKSLTRLDDEVIPALSGGSCTGAPSVIHPSSEFRVDIQLFTAEEFLLSLNQKLERLMGKQGAPKVHTVDEIASLDVSNYHGANSGEVGEFVENIVNSLESFRHDLTGERRTFTNKKVIKEYVAQYFLYDEIPEGEDPAKFSYEERQINGKNKWVYVQYFPHYLAVKKVDIYTPLPEDCGKCEFVDTIGMGAKIDTEYIKELMYDTLKNDCDVAVDVFRPDGAVYNFDSRQTEIIQDIKQQLAVRQPRKWMAYVANAVTTEANNNEANARKAIEEKTVKELFEKRVAVDATNREAVINNLINPLLDMVTHNLSDLDTQLLSLANQPLNEAYDACLSLVQTAQNVMGKSSGIGGDLFNLIDQMLIPEIDNELRKALIGVDDLGYAEQADKPCVELEEAYLSVVQKLSRAIPSPDVIKEALMTSSLYNEAQIFNEYVEDFRNSVFEAFENVNHEVLHPLQEKVKETLIRVLYNNARFNKLKVPVEGPSIQWFERFIEDYVSEKEYPALYKALRYILEYQISIEGMVEYYVTRSLYVIDRNHSDFIPYRGVHVNGDFEANADSIWQELFNRVLILDPRLKSWIKDFTAIPSHSFYSRVHKFHLKLITDKKGAGELRTFYINNRNAIWSDELLGAARTNQAFSSWGNRVGALDNCLKPEYFKF
ncbi:hypothetical protein [uncultured Parabacteroides sp.]|jgi:hypothetical protein|uniref:hypothetical protein n=2 Tax=uncultured Parabacteroides sp. TaxID=512312 RepID=UPI0025ED0189|nr:hypothetical protein [uncultured Parabacteroides sp.]